MRKKYTITVFLPDKVSIFCDLVFDSKLYNLGIQRGTRDPIEFDSYEDNFELALEELGGLLGLKPYAEITDSDRIKVRFTAKNTVANISAIYKEILDNRTGKSDSIHLDNFWQVQGFYILERPGSGKIWFDKWPKYIKILQVNE